MLDEIREGDVYTLTDDEDGSSAEYEVLGTYIEEDRQYVALIPCTDDAEEYIILRCDIDENGDDTFVTVDDDEEFDRVADYFDDQLFNEVDYDAIEEAKGE